MGRADWFYLLGTIFVVSFHLASLLFLDSSWWSASFVILIFWCWPVSIYLGGN